MLAILLAVQFFLGMKENINAKIEAASFCQATPLSADPSLNDPANYPMKQGLYQYKSQTVSSSRYPNGIEESGQREVKNELTGQKWVTNEIMIYKDKLNQSFKKGVIYEGTFFRDFNGEQRFFCWSTNGGYKKGTVVPGKNGNFSLETEALSNLLGKVVKCKTTYTSIKTGYEIQSTYYDEAASKWMPMRTGSLIFMGMQ